MGFEPTYQVLQTCAWTGLGYSTVSKPTSLTLSGLASLAAGPGGHLSAEVGSYLGGELDGWKADRPSSFSRLNRTAAVPGSAADPGFRERLCEGSARLCEA